MNFRITKTDANKSVIIGDDSPKFSCKLTLGRFLEVSYEGKTNFTCVISNEYGAKISSSYGNLRKTNSYLSNYHLEISEL